MSHSLLTPIHFLHASIKFQFFFEYKEIVNLQLIIFLHKAEHFHIIFINAKI